MSSEQMRPIIRTSTPSEERLYVQPRISVHIQEGDWQRWMRAISRIPNREGIFRDLAFALFGVSLPSLVSALILGITSSWSPDWPIFIYAIIGVGSLVGGGLSLYYDSKIEKVGRARVEDVLLDMKEVRERATVSEEKPAIQRPAPTIG